MRTRLITLILIALTGCSQSKQAPVIDPNALKMTDTVLQPNAMWLGNFEESDNTVIFYNLAVYKQILNQFEGRLKALELKTKYMPGPVAPVQEVD